MNQQTRLRKKSRIQAKVTGDTKTPRLAVFRSAKHLYGQLIDDAKMRTIAAANDSEVTGATTKTEKAYAAGQLMASKAKTLKIKAVRFDRGGFIYHGRVKAFADGAREGGLLF